MGSKGQNNLFIAFRIRPCSTNSRSKAGNTALDRRAPLWHSVVKEMPKKDNGMAISRVELVKQVLAIIVQIVELVRIFVH